MGFDFQILGARFFGVENQCVILLKWVRFGWCISPKFYDENWTFPPSCLPLHDPPLVLKNSVHLSGRCLLLYHYPAWAPFIPRDHPHGAQVHLSRKKGKKQYCSSLSMDFSTDLYISFFSGQRGKDSSRHELGDLRGYTHRGGRPKPQRSVLSCKNEERGKLKT